MGQNQTTLEHSATWTQHVTHAVSQLARPSMIMNSSWFRISTESISLDANKGSIILDSDRSFKC